MKKLTLLFAVLLMFSGVSSAQKLKQQGDLSFLKGESQVNVNVVFDDNMVVGKNMTEAQYIEKSVAERNEKEPGAGERWLAGWNGARTDLYIPKFMELLNKSVGGAATFGNYPDAKYTVVFNVTRIEPGFNIGVTRKPAEIDGVVYFYKSDDTTNSLAEVSITRAPGAQAMGYDFAVEQRVAESFAISGKRLGAVLKKQAYK